MAQVDMKALDSLSLAERDRRYSGIRAELSARRIDGLIVNGPNLQYLSQGLLGELFGFLPTEAGEKFTAILIWRFLCDIPPRTLHDAQSWVQDIRPAKNPNAVIVERLKELKLENATIGYAGRLGVQGYNFIMKQLPGLTLVDASDILANMRSCKSDEEVALIERANTIFGAAIDAIVAKVRPGMLGREIVQVGLQAMWDAGGDLDSTFSINFAKHPLQSPIIALLCQEKKIETGDVLTLTSHPHYKKYAGHTDQEIVIGDPTQAHVKMFDAVKVTHKSVLSEIKAGVTQRQLVNTYDKVARELGYEACEHSQIHQYGMEVPEFAGPAFKVDDPGGALALGSGGNVKLASGMIYSVSPVLIEPGTGDLLLGGTTMVVTDTGYRELGARPVEG
jgi:Xaa-Pro aminopeptidase